MRAPGPVDAARRPDCVGNERSGTEERRAYDRLGCGPSPFVGATGCFDATSTRCRLRPPELAHETSRGDRPLGHCASITSVSSPAW